MRGTKVTNRILTGKRKPRIEQPADGNGESGQEKTTRQSCVITAPNFKFLEVKVVGDAPLVQNKFSQKAKDQIANKGGDEEEGAKKKTRKKRDFDAQFIGAQHISTEGWNGIPAISFKRALISACKLVNYKENIAKMCIFVLPDGKDSDGLDLIKIQGCKPLKRIDWGRVFVGTPDVKARAEFPNWHCILRIKYDADKFKVKDILNLVVRAGMQCGVGEGRATSPRSCGMGWGSWVVEGEYRQI